MFMPEFAKRILKIYNNCISDYIDTSNCLVYHYTSPAGINGIISNCTLRFTDRNYLNDYTEGRYIMDLCLHSRISSLLPKEYQKLFKNKCKEMYKTPSHKSRYVYQCSFSMEKDNLALWNYYTKSSGIKGYNICFSASELSSSLEKKDPKASFKTEITHGKIIYDIRKQKSIIKNIISEFAKAIDQEGADAENREIAIPLLIDTLLAVGTFFKAPCFKHEKECRLVVRPFETYDKENGKFFANLGKFPATYEKNGLLIPYADLKFDKCVLKGITSSPTLDFMEVQANLKNALRIYEYDEEKIEICHSEIPVRY